VSLLAEADRVYRGVDSSSKAVQDRQRPRRPRRQKHKGLEGTNRLDITVLGLRRW
jgi:hypothetical protein